LPIWSPLGRCLANQWSKMRGTFADSKLLISTSCLVARWSLSLHSRLIGKIRNDPTLHSNDSGHPRSVHRFKCLLETRPRDTTERRHLRLVQAGYQFKKSSQKTTSLTCDPLAVAQKQHQSNW
jgi:hypothetical protein